MEDTDWYLSRLSQLAAHRDVMAETPISAKIRADVHALSSVTGREDVVAVAEAEPDIVPTLGLVVGLSQESLKNRLRHRFETTSWRKVARTDPAALVDWLDGDFDLMRLLREQIARDYTLADVLIARAGTRATAAHAGKTGRDVEDAIEAVLDDLRLPYEPRTIFTGRQGRTAPADFVIPDKVNARIVIAAKGFDSTGSKLSDALRELQDVAQVRLPRQLVLAVVDGIGWKSRRSDFTKIVELRRSELIDGLYSLNDLGQMRADIDEYATLAQLERIAPH